MTEKLYTIDVEEHTQENAIFCEDKYVCLEDDYDGVLAELNNLANEKSNLKCRLNRRTRQRDELAEFNVELMEKNKELKQFKKSVFALINEKITFVNECEKNHNDIGIPQEYYRGADEILNLLKKELQE